MDRIRPYVPDEESVEVIAQTSPRLDQGQDRITAVLNVYHEHFGDQPHSNNVTLSESLETVEQPFVRKMEVGTERMPLETGWLDEPGYVLLENVTGQRPTVIPSESEKEELARKCVTVHNDLGPPSAAPGWVIRPGRFFFGEVPEGSQLTLKCLHGTADIRLTVFPR